LRSINGVIHAFVGGDRSHPQSAWINRKLYDSHNKEREPLEMQVDFIISEMESATVRFTGEEEDIHVES
jgi:hypothetical protein